MVWPRMGEEVLPVEDLSVHELPLVPVTVQEVTLNEVHETSVVTPTCRSLGFTLSVADGAGTGLQALPEQLHSHAEMAGRPAKLAEILHLVRSLRGIWLHRRAGGKRSDAKSCCQVHCLRV